MEVVLKFNDATATLTDGERFSLSGCLHLESGKINLLCGANGCGKSMTLSAIAAALARPYLGFVRTIEGVQSSISPEPVSWIGLIRQDPLDNFMSRCSADEIVLPLLNAGETREDSLARINYLLPKLGVNATILTRGVGTLSAGQLQVLALAASLIPVPRVLLLDEAFARLDRQNRQRVAGVMQSRLQDTCVVAATHRTSEFVELFDETALTATIVARNGRAISLAPASTSSLPASSFKDAALQDNAPLGKLISSPGSRDGLQPSSYTVAVVPGAGDQLITATDPLQVFARGLPNPIVSCPPFSINAGLNLIIGDNSTGKTTLRKVLAGFIALNTAFRKPTL